MAGCVGYSGIDNSLAIEFDTFTNSYDPASPFGYDANHIAVQNCGSGVNSSSHYGPNPCLAIDDSTESSAGSINNNNFGAMLTDGNVHQAVVEYSGAQGSPANQLQVFIDPPFVSGTNTPCTATDVTNQATTGCSAAATAAIAITYNLSQHLNLLNGNSAYIGFTAATGASWETQELLAWTFTPHTVATQQQPLQPVGTQTTFPFGSHTYGVNYESGDTSGIDMVVSAITINPTAFQSLIASSSFAGSACQVYDGTGGNCVVYSVYCVTHGTTNVVACPASADPSQPLIDIKSAYENSISPTTPGFLQGDPLLSPINSISSNGDGTATATCTGECATAVGETVTILDSSDASYNVTTTISATTINTFTFASTEPNTGNGGYVTSNNLQNIFLSYNPQRIDGTTAGKTKNFSGFVALSTTLSMVGTTVSIAAPPISFGATAQITVSVTPNTGSGPVTGNVTLVVDGGAPLTQPLVSGSATFSVPGLSGGPHSLTASYAAQGNFGSSTNTGSQAVSLATPTVSFTGAPSSAPYLSTFPVAATTNASTTPLISAGPVAVCSIAGNIVTMNSGTGICNLTATWAPDSNYSGASLGQTTNASKLTPVISWNPAPIQLGAILGPAQLDASANVPGGFMYTPSAGAVVSTTTQIVSVVFTPAATANYNPANASVSLTVSAGPAATVYPPSISFGTVYLGTISTKNVTLANTGSSAMTVTGPLLSIVKGGDSHEFVEVNLCPKSLPAGKSCTMTIAFVAGPYYTQQTATLDVMDSAPGSPQTVMLTATVINPQASLSVSSLNFGTQKTGTPSAAKLITLKNTGATPLLINSIAVTGANPGDFPATPNCPSSLNAGSSCTISVIFDPSSKTSRSATLTIKDNAFTGQQTVALSGNGD